ncbi:MAG: pyruvate kinase [Nitrospinae bacterium]|nr:pyruvate kinase [Nitrospinota bacterium]
MRRNTKIVVTIGPSSSSEEKLEELIRAGVDVFRLNFSHGSHESHGASIGLIRKLSQKTGKPVGVLQDLCGPKIRVGKLEEPLTVEKGDALAICSGETCRDGAIPVNYPYLAQDVAPSERLLLADGMIELEVEEIRGDQIITRVKNRGVISSGKGVNFPDSPLRIEAFTEKDRRDFMFGLEMGVDFVAVSFVRSAEDLAEPVQIIRERRVRPMILAKIEKPQAMANLKQILKLADGIMVARGDLGVEMPLERVPRAQKEIIHATRMAGKPVITATQILTSMIKNPRPTRAEASDVANSILDGTDALMLSDETAVGEYPVESVKTLDLIARATEPMIDSQGFLDGCDADLVSHTAAAVSHAACWLARDLGASAIAAFTTSGATARLVSRFRPPQAILGLSAEPYTLRQLSLSWGIIPGPIPKVEDAGLLDGLALKSAREHGVAAPGANLIIIAGAPLGKAGTTNLVKVAEMAK